MNRVFSCYIYYRVIYGYLRNRCPCSIILKIQEHGIPQIGRRICKHLNSITIIRGNRECAVIICNLHTIQQYLIQSIIIIISTGNTCAGESERQIIEILRIRREPCHRGITAQSNTSTTKARLYLAELISNNNHRVSTKSLCYNRVGNAIARRIRLQRPCTPIQHKISCRVHRSSDRFHLLMLSTTRLRGDINKSISTSIFVLNPRNGDFIVSRNQINVLIVDTD